MARSKLCASCRDEKGHCDGAKVSCNCLCSNPYAFRCVGCERFITRYDDNDPNCCSECLMDLVENQIGAIAKWWIEDQLRSLRSEIIDLDDRLTSDRGYGGCSYCRY